METSVLDRTQVILEIFARNARTREAKLQIELAQAEFLMPRLAGLWKHLDRERGVLESPVVEGKSRLKMIANICDAGFRNFVMKSNASKKNATPRKKEGFNA